MDEYDAMMKSEMVADKRTMLSYSLEARAHIGIGGRFEGMESEDVVTEVRYHGAWYSRFRVREVVLTARRNQHPKLFNESDL